MINDFIFEFSFVIIDLNSAPMMENTRVYNVIFVPQITWLLIGDKIISSKIELRSGNQKEKRSYGKVRNNKTLLTTCHLSEFFILKKKQYSAILLQFKILKSYF